jgi:hypothetical protein
LAEVSRPRSGPADAKSLSRTQAPLGHQNQPPDGLFCILLRKIDIVVVSGFDAMVGLGIPCWALAKDAKTETASQGKH